MKTIIKQFDEKSVLRRRVQKSSRHGFQQRHFHALKIILLRYELKNGGVGRAATRQPYFIIG